MADKQGTPSQKQAYLFKDFHISRLNTPFILSHCSEQVDSGSRDFFDIQPIHIQINQAAFCRLLGGSGNLSVAITISEKNLAIACECDAPKSKLCRHQAQVLFNIVHRQEFRVFFDKDLRYSKIKEEALRYGLENEANLDTHFEIKYTNRDFQINPVKEELFPADKLDSLLKETPFLTAHEAPPPVALPQKGTVRTILVLGQHRFYKHFVTELFEIQVTKNGKVKNPLKSIKPLDYIWQTTDNEVLKFFTAIARFQSSYDAEPSESDIEALKALVHNPLQLDTYVHRSEISDSITASSIVPVKLSDLPIDLKLNVFAKDDFYELNAHILRGTMLFALDKLNLKYQYFLSLKDELQLVNSYSFLRVINFFREYGNKLLLHKSKFEAFKESFLSKLELKVHVNYAYLKPATKEQLQESSLSQIAEKIIYLKDSDDYILITPVIKYGHMEIPVLSKKQLYAIDIKGEPFTIPRDEKSELSFATQILKQHKDFEEQFQEGMNREYFYLHKFRFLDEDWFLTVFEEWKSHGITVLGFKEISNNNVSPHKAKITVGVNSGIDWFDASVTVTFGNEKVALKHIQKAVQNKSRYVQLGDGTQGVLPQEWIDRFVRYFNAGEIDAETLKIPKTRFSELETLFEEEMLSAGVKDEMQLYKMKIAQFEAIEKVEIPSGLKTTLRNYQKEGLNWMNFLDKFNFGGCLADDMGLGKTVQVIAFILSQKEKNAKDNNTNLIVVPTSLVFNWQAEVRKFAPSLNILTVHGVQRNKDTENFKNYDIILTTYGTLLSDVLHLKKHPFNYIILDESQAIKNPESQRYKAVKILKSRNKLILTGTPVENNTYDIFGQFSFACPGLLGKKRYFKQHFSDPIDKFKDKKRATELQRRISPFILRRTKEQVARELPKKTEMVIYCELGREQRRVYDAHARQYKDFLNKKTEDELLKHSMHVLQGLTKLRQICNSPSLLADEHAYGDTSAKIEVLMEQIENKSPDHKILIFSQFVSMLELIKNALVERGIRYQYLTGQTKDRATQVDNFQNNEEVRVFLISLKAGGTGLNLTEADYVFIVDPWWNPAVEEQAIDRSHRIGQTKNVIAVRLISPNTIEEKMIQLQESKKILASDIIQADTAIFKSLTKQDLLALI